MRRAILIILVVMVAIPVWARGKTAAHGSDGDPQLTAVVTQWMAAFEKRDIAALNAMGPATYDEWIVSSSDTLRKNISVEWALHPLTEYRIEAIKNLVPGQLAVAHVQEIVEDQPVREWEGMLTLDKRSGSWKVTHVSHIVMEFHMAGFPEGCPDTVFKREEAATLDGNLRGGVDPTFVRVFTTRRDTEPWGGGASDIDTEATKCQMKPKTVVQDLEWLVATWDGEILMTQQIGRTSGQNGGITLYEGSSRGTLTRGGVRLDTIVGGQPAVLFLSRKYQDNVARVGAYVWKGNGLKNVWNFDFMRKGATFAVDLKPDEGGKRVVATLQGGGEAIGCPTDTVIPFKWTGSTFKVAEKVKGGCTGTSWPGEGRILHRD
jgi:hypothetical protein